MSNLSNVHGLAASAPMELKDAFNQVVIDGRFINDFAANPQLVSNKLGFALSPESHAALSNLSQTSTTTANGLLMHQASDDFHVYAISIIVAVVIVVIVCVFISGDNASARTKSQDQVTDPNEDLKC
jgi:hypothetical protein